MDAEDGKLQGKVVRIGKSRQAEARAESEPGDRLTANSRPNRPTKTFTSRDVLRQALQEESAREVISEQAKASVPLPQRTSIPGGRGAIGSLLAGAMSRSNIWDAESLETAPSRPMLLPITQREIQEKGVFEARRRRRIERGVDPESNKDSVFQQQPDDLSDLDRKNRNKQKMSFVVGGTLLLAMACLQFLSAGGPRGVSGKEVILTRHHPDALWENPEMSSLEYYLCRGRSTKAGCSNQVYHPFVDWWESNAAYLRGSQLHTAIRNLRQTFYSPQKPPDE